MTGDKGLGIYLISLALEDWMGGVWLGDFFCILHNYIHIYGWLMAKLKLYLSTIYSFVNFAASCSFVNAWIVYFRISISFLC
ncbi:hypothetical protein EYC80_006155 [Monilinia laxa]|uniref:Uncharacterized protein n=1 Tax=Monilinia laxa TaxID=61186 RepID=A0A5N6KGA2_MONLA|nr:hypothetical protein EYC80_006155 [Monilinia laxa]